MTKTFLFCNYFSNLKQLMDDLDDEEKTFLVVKSIHIQPCHKRRVVATIEHPQVQIGLDNQDFLLLDFCCSLKKWLHLWSFKFSDQKYSRLRCLLHAKGLVICHKRRVVATIEHPQVQIGLNNQDFLLLDFCFLTQ